MNLEILATVVSQFGTAGIFIYLYFTSKQESVLQRDEIRRLNEDRLKEKEEVINSLNKNTNAIEKLAESIDTVLRIRQTKND